MKKFFILVMIAFLHACTCSHEQVKSPHWGQIACAHCRMAVGDKKNAAQLVGTGYRVHYYDDLGCALLDQMKRPELADWKLYALKDANADETWSLASELRFSEANHTPMGYGFAVSANGPLTLDEVRSRLKTSSKEVAP